MPPERGTFSFQAVVFAIHLPSLSRVPTWIQVSRENIIFYNLTNLEMSFLFTYTSDINLADEKAGGALIRTSAVYRT